MPSTHVTHFPSCLVVDFRGVNDEILCDPDWSEYWDTCLEENILSSEEEEWTADTYEEEGRNCLAFVLTFLRSLRTEPISSEARYSKRMCQKSINRYKGGLSGRGI